MKPIEIREVCLEDARIVAAALRPMDEVEVCLLHGKRAVEAVEEAVAHSDQTFIGYIGGEPAAIFGLAKLTDEIGIPWMLGTTALDKSAHRWLKEAQWWVDTMQDVYPILSNIVHRKNTKSIRWLKKLGFIFLDTQVPGKPDFIQFARYQHV